MKKIVLRVVAVVLVVLIAALLIWHRAAFLVFKNLTIPTVSLPEENWTGGQILRDIPYAEASETSRTGWSTRSCMSSSTAAASCLETPTRNRPS